MSRRVSLALHGGAGARPGVNYSIELDHMRSLIETGRDSLCQGASSVDVVTDTVHALESSGLYIAGRGASPNSDGVYELDACIMDGATIAAGGVGALCGFANPVVVARAVMERSPHVLLVGNGASKFARSQQIAEIEDPEAWFVPACKHEANGLPAFASQGTVGCVALDEQGRLAAATSTGGVFGKMPGRCGDSPIVGAGTWADHAVAVSCTGHGEFFLRVAAAVQVAHRVRWGAQSLEEASHATVADVAALGGNGGLIAIDVHGHVSMPFVSTGMKRAALLPDSSIISAVF